MGEARGVGGVRLRPLREADFDAVFAMQCDEGANALAGTKPRPREVFEAAMRAAMESPRVVPRVIVEGTGRDEVVVGMISCFVADDQDKVGYWIARSHWGRGVAGRALALLLGEVTRRPLYASAASHNAASRRALVRAGFRELGERMGEVTDRYVGCPVTEYVLDERGSGGAWAMRKAPPWVERTFRFEGPVERYPEVLVRYRGAPARAEELVRGAAREALAWRDEPGRWSALENIGHLLDLEGLWERRVEEYAAGAARLSAADMSNRATHDAGHNARDAGALLAAFRAARGRVVARLEAVDEETWARVSVHPRLNQAMRLVDAIEFTCQHDDYHLARVASLLARWRRDQAS